MSLCNWLTTASRSIAVSLGMSTIYVNGWPVRAARGVCPPACPSSRTGPLLKPPMTGLKGGGTGRGGRPRMHQCVTPTERRSERIGRLFQGRARPSSRLNGFGMRGSRVFHSSSVKSRVWRIPVLMQCGHSGINADGESSVRYFRFADHSGAESHRGARANIRKAVSRQRAEHTDRSESVNER
jgi:hypothetical protein